MTEYRTRKARTYVEPDTYEQDDYIDTEEPPVSRTSARYRPGSTNEQKLVLPAVPPRKTREQSLPVPTTRRNPARTRTERFDNPEPQPERHLSRRGALGVVFGGGATAILAGGAAGSYAITEIDRNNLQSAQGSTPFCQTEVKCHDRKTTSIVSAILIGDCFLIIENVGGDVSHMPNIIYTNSLTARGYTGGYDKVFPAFTAQPVDGGLVDLLLAVEIREIGVFAQPHYLTWTFIDDGTKYRAPFKAK